MFSIIVDIRFRFEENGKRIILSGRCFAYNATASVPHLSISSVIDLSVAPGFEAVLQAMLCSMCIG